MGGSVFYSAEKSENSSDSSALSASLKKDLSVYFKSLPEIFKSTGGKDLLVRHTRKIDNVVHTVYKVACRDIFVDYLPMKNTIPLAICAMGSYGREQLCIHSDIDLMLVYKRLPGYNMEILIEKILYILWDAGLKLGHRVHEVNEIYSAARQDVTIKTAMLESRFVDGSRFLWTEISNILTQIRRDDPAGFITEKLSERDRMRKRYPLTMEPNIKEGVGGFRDANTVYWIGKILYNTPRIKDINENIIVEQDCREFRISLEFLFRVRSALHILNGKKEDRLRLDQLPDLAELLRFGTDHRGQMKLARKVTKDLKKIHMYSTIWIEKMVKEYAGNRYENLFLPKFPDKEEEELCKIIEILNTRASRGTFDPHPALLDKLLHSKRPAHAPDKKIYRSLLSTFRQSSSYSVLKTISNAGLLGYTVPPLKKVVNLPQFDGFHRYTVDEHSLESLRYLENINDDFLKKLYGKLADKERQMLKIVTLLHDAGKGRKKDHHLVGSSLFRLFGKKIGMEQHLIEMGERLIQYHTLMSTTAQREDLYSEKAVMRFASRFGSEKMLDMIYLLTYADMNGVGSGIYNNFTSKLLHTLHTEAKKALSQNKMLDETSRRENRIESLLRSKTFNTLPLQLRRKILSIPSNAFFIRNSTKEIISIAASAESTDEYSCNIGNEGYLTIEIIRRRNLDLSYLLGELKRLQVVSMKIFKLFDELKYFKIDFNKPLDESEMHYLHQIVENSLRKKNPKRLKRPFIEQNEISVDCDHSREYATMTLRTRDQSGLLAYLIDIFDELGVDIASAKIHTVKGKVNDLFLIEKNGNFCHNIDLIVQRLTETECAE